MNHILHSTFHIVKLLPALLGLTLICACTSKEQPDEMTAGEAAEGYYLLLKSGHYAAFVEGMAGIDEFPEEYRRQLQQLVEQQMQTRWRKHGQWLSIDATDVQEQDSTASVMLSITYADNTSEQILLPMIFIDDEWYMQ